MTAPSHAILSAISTSCGFAPAVLRLLASRPATLAEAFQPGSVSVLIPVRRGQAQAAFDDPALEAYLAADALLVLAFEAKSDARRFARLVDRLCAGPAATHPAPGLLQ